MEDPNRPSPERTEKRIFHAVTFAIALAIVLCIGIFIAIVGFPGPMFSFANVTALPFGIAVVLGTLVCRRYWFVWPVLVHLPLWLRCGWRILEQPDPASSRYGASLIGQLLLKELYFSVPAVIAAFLLALGIHALAGWIFRKAKVRGWW